MDLRGRLLKAFAFLVLVTLVGVAGFSVMDPSAGLVRAFYMTAITLTTVGFGEVVAVDTDGARIFTAILILVGMGGTLYFVSSVTAFIIEGQLGHVFGRKKMERELARLEGHMIVCGSGPTAIYAVTELAAVQRPVVLVAGSASEAQNLIAGPSVPVVAGDPTDDDVLRAAGIERAGGVVACSESDNQNVVITLTARQLNPTVRIVARLQDVDQEAKIRKVGADAVVSPQHIGGLRLASELIRPTVVTFLDKMLRDRERNLRIDEIAIPPGAPAVGRQMIELELEDLPGVLLLAVREADGSWEYNPPRDQRIRENTALIFLGSPEDSRALRERLGGQRPTDASTRA